jgi:hypothetical protein
MKRLPAEHRPVRDQFQEYWRLREESLRLLAEGLREDSPEKVTESQTKAAAAEAVLEQPQKGR